MPPWHLPPSSDRPYRDQRRARRRPDPALPPSRSRHLANAHPPAARCALPRNAGCCPRPAPTSPSRAAASPRHGTSVADAPQCAMRRRRREAAARTALFATGARCLFALRFASPVRIGRRRAPLARSAHPCARRGDAGRTTTRSPQCPAPIRTRPLRSDARSASRAVCAAPGAGPGTACGTGSSSPPTAAATAVHEAGVSTAGASPSLRSPALPRRAWSRSSPSGWAVTWDCTKPTHRRPSRPWPLLPPPGRATRHAALYPGDSPGRPP